MLKLVGNSFIVIFLLFWDAKIIFKTQTSYQINLIILRLDFVERYAQFFTLLFYTFFIVLAVFF